MQNPTMGKQQPVSAIVVVTIALWLLVAVSALLVVGSTHAARLSYFQLESLRRNSAELEVERGQYLLEQSTWAAYGRVEKLAQEKLNMHVPKPADLIMVSP